MKTPEVIEPKGIDGGVWRDGFSGEGEDAMSGMSRGVEAPDEGASDEVDDSGKDWDRTSAIGSELKRARVSFFLFVSPRENEAF